MNDAQELFYKATEAAVTRMSDDPEIVEIVAQRIVASYKALQHLTLIDIQSIHRGALVICEDEDLINE